MREGGREGESVGVRGAVIEVGRAREGGWEWMS